MKKERYREKKYENFSEMVKLKEKKVIDLFKFA